MGECFCKSGSSCECLELQLLCGFEGQNIEADEIHSPFGKCQLLGPIRGTLAEISLNINRQGVTKTFRNGSLREIFKSGRVSCAPWPVTLLAPHVDTLKSTWHPAAATAAQIFPVWWRGCTYLFCRVASSQSSWILTGWRGYACCEWVATLIQEFGKAS